MTRLGTAAVTALGLVALTAPARADQPMTQLAEWSGGVEFFTTGAPLAVDGPDVDQTKVDMLAQPASVTVTVQDLPGSPPLLAAFLYWGGSVVDTACAQIIDDTVDFTAPGGMPTPVKADKCYCSDAGAQSYDVQLCRKDVSGMVSGVTGTYTVDKFAALIQNGSTNNASFSIVLVVRTTAAPRRISLWDGLQTMSATVNKTQTFTLGNLEVDDPPEGDLTWYVLEGDVGGSQGEQVSVLGQPGAKSLVLQDALNPPANPMNHTINTTTPPQNNSLGVDIDKFDISAALTAGDTAVQTTYEAGNDKWWLAYNIVAVNVYEPLLGAASTKSWKLQVDADNDTIVSVGDTVRYTIHLENTGSAPAVVALADAIPPEAMSWMLIDAAGGTDSSSANTMAIGGIAVAIGAWADVVFDVVIADVPDETAMKNEAEYDATPDGDKGTITAPAAIIRRDGDADTIYDNDDNCPMTPNMSQVDSDMDGLGDACDATNTGGMGGAAGAGAGGGMGGAGPATATSGVGGMGGVTQATTASGGPQGPDLTTDSSCGCRVVGQQDAALWWLALGSLLAARRRRRRI